MSEVAGEATAPEQTDELRVTPTLANILRGVVAVVQLRSADGSNAGVAVERLLQSMGAKIRRTFTAADCTHLVFNKGGSMLQYNRARAAKAHIVNVLWAERCREDGKRADESAFAVGGSVPPGEATNASRIQLPSLITASAVTPGGAQSHARRSMEPHVLVAADVNNRRHSLSALKQQRTPLGGLSTSANGTPVTALTARSTSAGGTPSSAAPFKTPLPKAKKRKRSDGKEDKDKDEKENITCNSLHDEENQVSNTLHDKENAIPDNVGAADYTTSTAINKPRRAAAMRVAKAVAEMYAASANPEDVASDSASNSSSADTNVALATSVKDKFAADEDDDTLDERRTRALFAGYRPPLASEETPMPRKIQRLPHLVFTGFQEEYGGKWGGVGGRMIPFIRNSEYETLLSAVNHLGSFQTVDSVTARTSHVVCKSKKRTMNVMKAIANGSWLLDESWIWASLEKDRWLPEMDHQVPYFGSHLMQSAEGGRRARCATLLDEAIKVFVDPALDAKQDLAFLVRSVGGVVTSTLTTATVVIGSVSASTHRAPVVSETWLYDTIMRLERQPFDAYSADNNDVPQSRYGRRTRSLPTTIVM